MRNKFVSRIGTFKDSVFFDKGWRGFEKSEPGAFYSFAIFCVAPFLPVVSYFGFKWFGGIDITKAYPHIDSREKFVFFNDKSSGKDDVGAVFEYHYDDGTKQVVFNK
ncbi:hypothetical protein C9374_007384 [Naegleria lovaniensis]|uniref:Uncharacterized protein n=1 Tax=Naegleria lovaniensis TaxID=51637 RepID=A0AA88GLV1_NAELO|nr:uncharacterized protein C9374_007384 [Naegleria lovaniensis]KAG2379245.1 hypothetical protein C9374_007384 [Naegleria lovaniensis]